MNHKNALWPPPSPLAFVISHSARAADWETVVRLNVGKQANALLAVATAAENDVWAVGASYSSRFAAYRTVIEHGGQQHLDGGPVPFLSSAALSRR